MASIPKAREKVEAEKKVFFHEHPLQGDHTGKKEGVTCRFCLEDNITRSVTYMCPTCPNYAVHWGCATYNKECRHASHPHMLKLVQKQVSKVGCDGCGNSIDRGFYYTCTEQSCNFDLHPLCATRPLGLLLPALPNLGFHSNTRAPSTLARQHSGTSKVPKNIEERRIKERRRAKQAAEEQRRKEKEARREEKAKRDKEEIINRVESMLNRKLDRFEASGKQRHQECISISEEIIRMLVHSTTRAVPRLVLCAEGTSTALKLLTILPVGLKSVQLHLLCENAKQPHVVADAKGCQIFQKAEGNRWNNLQPLIAVGLQIVAMAIKLIAANAALGPLNTLLPNFSQKVWDIQAIDAVPSGPKERVPEQDLLAKEEAEEAAAEWLLRYLKDQNINIAQAFGLYRVLYINSPNYPRGTIGWLCQNHLKQGMEEKTLKRFPVR